MSKYETWKIWLPLKISVLVIEYEVTKCKRFARFYVTSSCDRTDNTPE